MADFPGIARRPGDHRRLGTYPDIMEHLCRLGMLQLLALSSSHAVHRTATETGSRVANDIAGQDRPLLPLVPPDSAHVSIELS